jgi:hypothetical protein
MGASKLSPSIAHDVKQPPPLLTLVLHNSLLPSAHSLKISALRWLSPLPPITVPHTVWTSGDIPPQVCAHSYNESSHYMVSVLDDKTCPAQILTEYEAFWDVLIWRPRGRGSSPAPQGRFSPTRSPAFLPREDLAHLDDVVCCSVQAGARVLQAWCVVACLIAVLYHCLQGQQVWPTGPMRSSREHSRVPTWGGTLLTRGSLKVTQCFTRSPKASKHKSA